jgi:hypothetical protein
MGSRPVAGRPRFFFGLAFIDIHGYWFSLKASRGEAMNFRPGSNPSHEGLNPMTQADSVHSTPPLNTSATDDDLHTPESLQDALYRRTDISPETFFQALGRVRKAARDEIERLIAWLDSTIDVDEDSAADDEPCDDRELEPSLGSFDRMSDQIKAWQGGNYDVDAELDRCDDEDSDPAEASEASGIGDQDGLVEQTGQQDWQPIFFV